MIYLFTDFGYSGPYVGELHAKLSCLLPNTPIIDLMHDAPTFDPRASAYLLAALSKRFQPGDICLGVVDPDVGMSTRRAIIIEADGVIYCGPDNGLFSQVVGYAKQNNCYEIVWRPQKLSSSFHARDLFAPALALHVQGKLKDKTQINSTELIGSDWPVQLDEVIYIDHFGNAVTGRQAASVSKTAVLEVEAFPIRHAETFAAVSPGETFWYENSMGLIELAVNQGSASQILMLDIGTKISFPK